MHRSPSASGIAMILSCLLVMASCRAPDAGPERSNRLVIALSASPKSLDPRLATDVASARVQQLLYNSLVKKNRKSELVPDLAEKWEIVDNRTYRFHIRKNIRFHDGKHLTARDVKATFDAILSDKLASPKKGAYEKLESIIVEDDYTIVFRTTEPFAPFLVNMVQGILPASEASRLDPGDTIHPVGTGPFRFVSRETDDTITLAAFPDCFAGAPTLNSVVFRIIPDDTIRVMELEKGTIDFLQNAIPADAVKRLRSNRDLTILTAPGTSYYYLGFNFRLDYPCTDRRVRQALAMGLNRDAIIEHVLGGLATKAVSVLPAEHWAFEPALQPIPFNPVDAGKLLDEAGYPIPADGGYRFTIQFKTSQNKQSQRLAEIVQAQWRDIGVDVSLRSLEWGTFYDDILKGNFQAYILSWVGVTDPDIYFSLFHSQSMPPRGRNRGYYRNPAMDKLLESARVTLDRDARAVMYREVQQIAAEDLPYISLWHTDNVAVFRKNLVGYEMYPAGDFDSISQVHWRQEQK